MARVTIVFCLLLAVVAATSKKKKPSGSNGKIVGGSEVDISNVPYQVSLLFRKKHDCGGSIIGAQYILTAAHCVYGEDPSDYMVRVGSQYNERGGEIRRVIKIITHSEYSEETLKNDIALLKLDQKLTFNGKIKPVPLAEREPAQGEAVLVSGWGAMNEGGASARILQAVTVPVVNRQTCGRIYLTFGIITPNMFCAGYMRGGKDACQGDSGGPAVVNGRLAGVVSWGRGCAKRNSPGVYTNVAKYRSWIQTQTR